MSLQDLVKYRDSGELSDIAVIVEDEELKLHKFPLYIKSDFFKEASREAGKDRVDLADFPGGAECFKLIADFCYNKRIDISLENVAQLRCGAEYLKMAGENNLIDLTERYLDDVLRSAQMSRSLAPIVDLIGRSSGLGAAAEEAKIAERCFATVMDVWTKPGGRVDSLVVDRLLRLPLDWFERLAKSCAEASETERQLRPLAELACRYLHRVFQREAQQEKPQEQKKKKKSKDKDAPAKEAKKKAEKEKDEDDDAGEAEEVLEEQTQQQASADGADDAEASDAEADAAEAATSKQQQKQQQQQQQDCEPKEPAGEVLDRVVASLPEAAPLGDVISGDWIRQALELSEKHSCECRPRLLQLAGNMLHRFRQEELKQMPSPVLCDIVSTSLQGGSGGAGEGGEANAEPELLSGVIDNHLLDLARSGGLTPEDFAKLAASVPADYRSNHDTLYEAAETLLTAGESIPDDQQKAVIDAVDLSRCDVTTLQRALDKGAFPAKVVCQAAIDLAQKSRSQNPEVKSARRDDFRTPAVYTSPTRAYRTSAGYDGGSGYNSYREPSYGTGKYQDLDFDASRYSAYDSSYSGGRGYTRKW